jgi:hypothetical protein
LPDYRPRSHPAASSPIEPIARPAALKGGTFPFFEKLRGATPGERFRWLGIVM